MVAPREPCPYCENFEGRYSSVVGPPAVVHDDDVLQVCLAPAPLGGMDGHALVLPKRHVPLLFDLTSEEEAALAHAVARVGRAIRTLVDPDGLLVLQRNGLAAEQMVPHVHFHVIPRREGTPFPPTEWQDVVPPDERQALADRLRVAWDAAG